MSAGPVLLVGHSYGGPVITYAASKSVNAIGLVFVAAFGIDTGESALGSVSNYPDPGLGVSLEPKTYPGSDEPEFYIKQDLFRTAFAADLPEDVTAIGAVSQRPVSALALGEPLTVAPAWKTLPNWFAVATEDHASISTLSACSPNAWRENHRSIRLAFHRRQPTRRDRGLDHRSSTKPRTRMTINTPSPRPIEQAAQ